MNISGAAVNIFRSKTRSLLTMTGIAVGVFAVVLISTIGAAGTAQVSNTLTAMGVDTLLVQPAGKSVSVTLTDEDAKTVRRIDGVNDVMPLMASVTEAKMIGKRLSCYVWGVDKSAGSLISLEAKHGRLISPADSAGRRGVCVVDEQFALETYGRANIVGKHVSIFLGGKYHEFGIIGVARSGLSGIQGALTNIMPGFMYIPLTTMQRLCGRTTYDKLAVKLDHPDDEPQTGASVIRAVEDSLDRAHSTTGAFAVNNLLSQKRQLKDILGIVTAALSLIAGISLAVSGISVMTTMMMSVSERTREIGIKKAVGGSKRDICSEFLTESILLALIGCAGGIAAGLIVSAVGCRAAGVPFAVNMGAVMASAGAAALIGAVFGAYPAVKAANMDPVEALRS